MRDLFKQQLRSFYGSEEVDAIAVDDRTRSFLKSLSDVLENAGLNEGELLRERAEQAELIQKLEEAHSQLLQSEKMASIGSLAAGVAHEINNPIGFVSSNMNSLKGYIEDLLSVIEAYCDAGNDELALRKADQLAKDVDLVYLKEDTLILLSECQDGISRVRRIVQDLKDFSHVDQGEWVVTDLHKGLDSTLNIVNNEIKYKATVVKDYGKIPAINCIGSQINQVFLNLLVNAAHAIDKQGTITIKTEYVDDCIRVSVSDTGCGIPEDNLKRIFDPFFTTKPVGKGTGLGLSLSYGIVKSHGGHIDVSSTVGVGTRFTVVLPVSTALSTVNAVDFNAGTENGRHLNLTES